jgi:hypothetical protein
MVCNGLEFFYPIVWILGVIKRKIWHHTEGKRLIIEIEKSKPGFQVFYDTWRKEKSKEKLLGVLAVAGLIAAAAIGTALTESDYDRTRRAVRDELNSR